MAPDPRFPRLTIGLMTLGLSAMARPALADGAPARAVREPVTPEARTVTESVSYGPTVAVLYGIGYAGIAGAYFMSQRERADGVRLMGAIVGGSAVITMLFGPMLAHFDHDSMGKGFLSVGGQVAAALGGAAVGYGVASLSGAEEPSDAMLVGAAGAHAGWAVYDTLVLAREERVLERTISAPRYALSLEPGGVRAGLRFRF